LSVAAISGTFSFNHPFRRAQVEATFLEMRGAFSQGAAPLTGSRSILLFMGDREERERERERESEKKKKGKSDTANLKRAYLPVVVVAVGCF